MEKFRFFPLENFRFLKTIMSSRKSRPDCSTDESKPITSYRSPSRLSTARTSLGMSLSPQTELAYEAVDFKRASPKRSSAPIRFPPRESRRQTTRTTTRQNSDGSLDEEIVTNANEVDVGFGEEDDFSEKKVTSIHRSPSGATTIRTSEHDREDDTVFGRERILDEQRNTVKKFDRFGRKTFESSTEVDTMPGSPRRTTTMTKRFSTPSSPMSPRRTTTVAERFSAPMSPRRTTVAERFSTPSSPMSPRRTTTVTEVETRSSLPSFGRRSVMSSPGAAFSLRENLSKHRRSTARGSDLYASPNFDTGNSLDLETSFGADSKKFTKIVFRGNGTEQVFDRKDLSADESLIIHFVVDWKGENGIFQHKGSANKLISHTDVNSIQFGSTDNSSTPHVGGRLIVDLVRDNGKEFTVENVGGEVRLVFHYSVVIIKDTAVSAGVHVDFYVALRGTSSHKILHDSVFVSPTEASRIKGDGRTLFAGSAA